MKPFIYFADLPPSPIDEYQIQSYIDLGFNYVIICEDNVKLLNSDGKLSKDYIHAIENLGNHGLKVLIRNMYNDKDYFINDNESTRSNYGNEYFLTKRNITNEFSSIKCVKGFYMADEPFMKPLKNNPTYANFEDLKKLIDYKNKYYPDLLFHMNMVPSSSYDHYCYSGETPKSYQQFIQAYIDTFICKLRAGEKTVCLDNYPFIGKNYIEKNYLFDLLTASTLTKKYNDSCYSNEETRFGLCIQTFYASSANGDGRKRDITLASEVSFQLFTGLALGATVYEYFCFRSFPKMPGILNTDFSKRIYDYVKEGNDMFMPFEAKLSSYRWFGAYFQYGENIYESYNGASLCSNLLIDKLPSLKVNKNSHDILVGVFENKGDYTYLIVNFTDPIKCLSNEIELNSDNKTIKIFNGKEEISNNSNQLLLKLKAGEAVFIK